MPGVHNLSIWKALSGSKIRLVGVRHEQAAVYAADGFARTTGRLGVALVTTGPGAASTLGATDFDGMMTQNWLMPRAPTMHPGLLARGYRQVRRASSPTPSGGGRSGLVSRRRWGPAWPARAP